MAANKKPYDLDGICDIIVLRQMVRTWLKLCAEAKGRSVI